MKSCYISHEKNASLSIFDEHRLQCGSCDRCVLPSLPSLASFVDTEERREFFSFKDELIDLYIYSKFFLFHAIDRILNPNRLLNASVINSSMVLLLLVSSLMGEGLDVVFDDETLMNSSGNITK